MCVLKMMILHLNNQIGAAAGMKLTIQVFFFVNKNNIFLSEHKLVLICINQFHDANVGFFSCIKHTLSAIRASVYVVIMLVPFTGYIGR